MTQHLIEEETKYNILKNISGDLMILMRARMDAAEKPQIVGLLFRQVGSQFAASLKCGKGQRKACLGILFSYKSPSWSQKNSWFGTVVFINGKKNCLKILVELRIFPRHSVSSFISP